MSYTPPGEARLLRFQPNGCRYVRVQSFQRFSKSTTSHYKLVKSIRNTPTCLHHITKLPPPGRAPPTPRSLSSNTWLPSPIEKNPDCMLHGTRRPSTPVRRRPSTAACAGTARCRYPSRGVQQTAPVIAKSCTTCASPNHSPVAVHATCLTQSRARQPTQASSEGDPEVWEFRNTPTERRIVSTTFPRPEQTDSAHDTCSRVVFGYLPLGPALHCHFVTRLVNSPDGPCLIGAVKLVSTLVSGEHVGASVNHPTALVEQQECQSPNCLWLFSVVAQDDNDVCGLCEGRHRHECQQRIGTRE